MTGPASLATRPGPQWTPLSYSQQRLWLFSRLSPDSTAYNLGGLLWLEGELDMTALQATMNVILARHDILRARFAEFEGRAWQTIEPHEDRVLAIEDVSDEPDPVAATYALARQQNATPFDLEAGGLLRYRLAKLGHRNGQPHHALLISLHHIAGDAWSLGVFMQEFFMAYSALRDGRDAPLPALKKQYPAFAQEQQQWLESERAGQQLAYWKDALRHEGEPLALPRLNQSGGASQPARFRDFALTAEQNAALKAFAGEQGVSRFTVLLAVLQYLLARVTGQREIRVGVPSANRGTENNALIGFFVNNLVVQGLARPDFTVSDWIAHIHQSLEGAKQHKDLPFEKVVEALCPSRSQGQHPLFQVAFNYRRQGKGMSLNLDNLMARVEDLPVTETPFDLVLDVWPDQDGGLGLRLVHGEGVLDDRFAEQLQRGFENLLAQCLAEPSRRLPELSVLTTSDHQWLDEQGQGSGEWLPESFVSLFSKQAQAQGDAIALVHGDTRVSFAALEARS
ncbi:MAG: condensation domain-containing protein, partial [Pseudomonadales bacterium]|nr:condensation domain-containing protein [Pseudomonadales bacterium]